MPVGENCFSFFGDPNEARVFNYGLPPDSVMEWADINHDTAATLAELNDTGSSFYFIADYIEHNL